MSTSQHVPREAKQFSLGQLVSQHPDWAYKQYHAALVKEWGSGLRKQEALRLISGIKGRVREAKTPRGRKTIRLIDAPIVRRIPMAFGRPSKKYAYSIHSRWKRHYDIYVTIKFYGKKKPRLKSPPGAKKKTMHHQSINLGAMSKDTLSKRIQSGWVRKHIDNVLEGYYGRIPLWEFEGFWKAGGREKIWPGEV